MIHEVPIGDLVLDRDTWDPGSEGEGEFDYIDLSSIDKDDKIISTVERIACHEAPSRARQLVKAGDVLVATVRPNLNGVAMVCDEHDGMTASTGYTVLRTDSERLDPAYLFHWVRTPVFVDRMVSVATGASYPAVSDTKVKASEIPLPPLPEQKRIAAILDAADALRTKRRESLQQLDELVQSVFLDMFGDPVTNPKGWEVQPLGDWLDTIDSGWSPKCLKRAAALDEWGVLKLGAVTWCEYDETEQKALPVGIDPKLGKEVRAGDVLFARKNTADLVGAAAYVWRTRPRLMMPDLVFRLRISEDSEIDPIYLWQLLVNGRQRRVVQALASGAAGSMPNISKRRLLKVLVPKPPLSWQTRFADTVRAIQNQKDALRSHLAELDTLFTSLQSRAFRGEL